MPRFFLPTTVIYGVGCFSELVGIVSGFSPSNVLVVAGSSSLRKSGHLDRLEGMVDCEVSEFHIPIEPSLELIMDGVSAASGVDLVVGLGGGSVLDGAKAIAILATGNPSIPEVWGGAEVTKPGLPFVAVPSTSGTGSEVTRVSVVTDVGDGFKKAFRHDLMYPKVAVVDPELTLSCPSSVTASSGLDALSHALESFTSATSTPATRPLGFRAMEFIHKNLVNAFEDGGDIVAREGMSQGSLFAGMAISNSGLGLGHGIAHALGYRWKIPHGVACGFLLPYSVLYNMGSTRRYDIAAKAFGLNGAKEFADHLFELNRQLGLKESLSDYGVTDGDLQWIAEHSFSGSMLANPRKMTESDVVDLLTTML